MTPSHVCAVQTLMTPNRGRLCNEYWFIWFCGTMWTRACPFLRLLRHYEVLQYDYIFEKYVYKGIRILFLFELVRNYWERKYYFVFFCAFCWQHFFFLLTYLLPVVPLKLLNKIRRYFSVFWTVFYLNPLKLLTGLVLIFDNYVRWLPQKVIKYFVYIIITS